MSKMTGLTNSREFTEADPTVSPMTRKMITIIEIIKRDADILEVTDLHTKIRIGHISEEIILGSPEEVLPNTEVTNPDMSPEEDLVTNINHMDLTVTMVMLLHTEVMAGEVLHHTMETVGETSTITTTDLKDTEENPVALLTDTTTTTEEIDRALDLPEEGQWSVKGEIPDSLQLEVDHLNSAEDQHQEIIMKKK